MSNIVKFDKANVPAHLSAMFNATNDLSAGVSSGFPVLSIKGKVWTVVRGKDDRKIIKNEDGDPRSSIEVVIIKANPNISKVFYAKGFTEGMNEKPDCYSENGIGPDAGAANPQAKKCALCPQNQWGSKISDNGAKLKACSDSRRVAVAPAGDLRDPMLLRVPAASLRPLGDYGDMFARKGVPYQAAVTRMGFDAEAASPKLTFRYERFLDEDEAAAVHELMESSVVAQIIGGSAYDEDSIEVAPAPAAAPAKPAKVAPAKAKDEDEDEPAEEAPKPKAVKKAKPEVKEIEDDDLASALDDVLGSLDD